MTGNPGVGATNYCEDLTNPSRSEENLL